MSRVSKFEAALLTVPWDLISIFVQYGAERAFMWTGVDPNDRDAFFLEQGAQLRRLKQFAAEKQLPYGVDGKE